LLHLVAGENVIYAEGFVGEEVGFGVEDLGSVLEPDLGLHCE
jgi:hypothetical protein